MRNTPNGGLLRGSACLLLLVLAATSSACTSSNTPTTQSNQAFNPNEYRTQTTSQQQYSQQTPGGSTEPVYTLMEVATETGEIHPGEEYIVFAVADNPDNKPIEYHWSVVDGTLNDIREADKGRIQSLIEAEAAAIRAGTTDPGSPATTAAPAAAPPVPADGTAPPATAPPAAATTAPVPAPGSSSQPPASVVPLPPAVPYTEADLSEEEKTYPADIKALLIKLRNNQALTQEEQTKMEAFNRQRSGKASGSARLAQRRFVGNEGTQVNPPEAASGQATDAQAETQARDPQAIASEALEAARRELDKFRSGPGTAANVADAAPAVDDDKKLKTEDDFVRGSGSRMRDEYESWSTGRGELRRRSLGGEELDETEAVTAEESYAETVYVTDVPYVVWTPSRPGASVIYCKLVYKKEDLTDPVALEVEVSLRSPVVNISETIPDVLQEDDDLFVRLDAENLPDFKKGLLTVNFDPDVLSFRSAELGEFFDDAPRSSIFYAEPSKTAGKVLLAIDSNTEIAELSGDGPLVYAKFRVKRPTESAADSKLALDLDSAARYILDRNGVNILPVPVEKQPFRSTRTQPPAQTALTQTAGTTPPVPGAAAQPGAGQQPPALPSSPVPGTQLPGQLDMRSGSNADATAAKDKTSGTAAAPESAAEQADKAADEMIGPLPPAGPPAAQETKESEEDADTKASDARQLKGKSN